MAADDGIYDLDKILAAMPISPDLVPADVFLSYAHEDRVLVESLDADLRKAGIVPWFDRELRTGQRYRDVIAGRIESCKAVVVLWTERSIKKDFVIDEAERARLAEKIFCVYQPPLAINNVPPPYSTTQHMTKLDDRSSLIAALAVKGIGARER